MEFIDRMGFVRDRLPKALQTGQEEDNKQQWEFKGTGAESRVRALSSSSQSGRSFAASLIVHDEADFHPELEASYGATGPIIDNGGRHVSLSSSNPDNGPESFFKQRSLAAMNGSSGYKFLFFDCWARPDHSEEWYEMVSKRYSPDRLHKEHPRNLEEALEAPQTLQGIDHRALDELKTRVRDPLKFQEGQPADSRIFVKFVPGHTYTAFTDTAHGEGNDFSVTNIFDGTVTAVVADIVSRYITPRDLAFQSVKLLAMYDNPLWGIEDNDWGISTIENAINQGYKRLYHRPVSAVDNSNGRVGFTTNKRTRPLLIGELVEGCLSGQLTVYAEDGLGQFYDLTKKDGKIEALAGRNDDYPMAVGGALMMFQSGKARKSRHVELVDDGEGGYELRDIFRRMKRNLPAAPIGRRW
jgi:hypothetical protein